VRGLRRFLQKLENVSFLDTLKIITSSNNALDQAINILTNQDENKDITDVNELEHVNNVHKL
jgi:hypothetical protein